jgi:hypothetical protein
VIPWSITESVAHNRPLPNFVAGRSKSLQSKSGESKKMVHGPGKNPGVFFGHRQLQQQYAVPEPIGLFGAIGEWPKKAGIHDLNCVMYFLRARGDRRGIAQGTR